MSRDSYIENIFSGKEGTWAEERERERERRKVCSPDVQQLACIHKQTPEGVNRRERERERKEESRGSLLTRCAASYPPATINWRKGKESDDSESRGKSNKKIFSLRSHFQREREREELHSAGEREDVHAPGHCFRPVINMRQRVRG